MTGVVLPDDAARERIRSGREASLVVHAGAGAGKTTTMVDRLVGAVLVDEVGLDRIVAISFTERSARDLGRKVRLALDRHRPGTNVDRAFLGTIHAFCRSILATYPIDAGLPPAFTTTDDITSDLEADRRTRRVVRRLYDTAQVDPAVAEALGILVRSAGDPQGALVAVVRRLDLQWHRLEGWTPRPSRLDGGRAALDALQVRLRELVDVGPSGDQLCAALASWADAIAHLPDGLQARRAALAELDGFGNKGAGKAWQAATGCSPKEIRDECKAAREAAVAAVDATVVERLLAVVVPAVVAEARLRLADGHVSFDDLLVLAARLVRDVPTVRTALRERYERLFVDEYQDTDGVQHELITELASTDGTIDPGRLFVVGDPKQSIYAFRAAEVRLLTELTDRHDTEHVELVTNFRSRPGIIEWVNATAGPWFASRADQVPFTPLRAARVGPPVGTDPGPDVVVLGLETAPGTRPTDARRAEAEDLAAVVVAARAEGWAVRNADGEGEGEESYRPIRFGDIAVLLRSRAGLAGLEAAFRRAGIPYRLDGGSLVYDTREVRELLRVLRALDDPTDELALVTALRTTVIGLRDDDLLAHRRAGGRWDLFAAAPPPGPVADAFGRLRALVADKSFRTPAELLTQLAEQHLSWASALVEGPQAARETWRRVRYVIDEARAFADSTGGTLREYLAWVDRQVADETRREVSPDETDEDAVRVLTIHAAKGLEYPMVLVAGLGTDPPPGAAVELRWLDDALVARFGGLRPSGVTQAQDLEREARKAEEARLVYVACTRAMDHLVVSCHGGRSTEGIPRSSMLKGLVPHARVALGAEHRAPSAAPEVPRPVPEVPAAPDPSARLAGGDVIAARLAAAERRSVWSATAVAGALGGHRSAANIGSRAAVAVDEDVDDERGLGRVGGADLLADPLAEPDPLVDAGGAPYGQDGTTRDDDDLPTLSSVDTRDDEPADPGLAKDPRPLDGPPEARGRYGTAVGRAVHQVMQLVELAGDGNDLDRLAEAAAVAEDVAPAHRPAVVRLARSIFTSAIADRMRQAALVRRELYVGAPIGDQVVWGYLDAVFADDDGRLVVVDFKTDQAPDGPEALLDRYRGQLASYLLALGEATGRPVGDAWLVVARDDGTPAACVALTGTARDAALAEVRAVLTAGA
ncbi:MAG: UvrD-helicase domain-containing protein [Acidimicrobiales bacterium]